MQQKDIFLSSEADAWFQRNKQLVAGRSFATDDAVSAAAVEIAHQSQYLDRKERIQILEVGCGEGLRLTWLSENLRADVFGVEPSAMAVSQACSRGVAVQRGTADSLPFENAKFDILIFGFCLYLCDRHDLFRIAQEADRVLKPDAWLLINDFFAPTPVRREYHHKTGVYSYKMDYRELFDWHPAYTCYAHKLNYHGQSGFTDDPQEWVATSVMRKKAMINE
jgi:ubiquinone/menaquinone biosynthesis C-methylase UbiE